MLSYRVTLEQGLVWVRSSWALFIHSKELAHTDSIVSIQVTLKEICDLFIDLFLYILNSFKAFRN